LASVTTLARAFLIRTHFTPGNPEANRSAVQSDPLTFAYANARTTKNGDTAHMVFINAWVQRFKVTKSIFQSRPGWQPDGDPVQLTAPRLELGARSMSPIIVDVNDNGITLGASGDRVLFDLDSSGNEEWTQWVRSGEDDALLVRDINGDGQINDGSELMGEGTHLELYPGQLAVDGFDALAQFDRVSLGGNADGWIDASDLIWNELNLWTDLNADGRTDPQEVTSLESHQIVSFRLEYEQRDINDDAGNDLRLWSIATGADGHADRNIVDVFFNAYCLEDCD